MTEINKLLEAYKNIDFLSQKAALATVVSVQGSAYRRVGARMLITDSGQWTGAISGGCLEGDALRKARKVMSEQIPKTIIYDTTNEESAKKLGASLGCEGIIDVLIEPILNTNEQNPLFWLAKFAQNNDFAQKGQERLATVFESNTHIGEKLFLDFENNFQSNISDKILKSSILNDLKNIQKSTVKHYNNAKVLLEVLQPATHLLVFGGGYDAVPLVNFAKQTGFQVTLTDDCAAHVIPKRFPAADCLLYVPRQNIAQQLIINKYTAAVLISHNYDYDLSVLKQLLPTPIAYIGMIGTKKRSEKMKTELHNDDLKALFEAKVHSPAGLDIGAETPEEIALSVLAEIKAHFNHRNGTFLKLRQTLIHDND